MLMKQPLCLQLSVLAFLSSAESVFLFVEILLLALWRVVYRVLLVSMEHEHHQLRKSASADYLKYHMSEAMALSFLKDIDLLRHICIAQHS